MVEDLLRVLDASSCFPKDAVKLRDGLLRKNNFDPLPTPSTSLKDKDFLSFWRLALFFLQLVSWVLENAAKF